MVETRSQKRAAVEPLDDIPSSSEIVAVIRKKVKYQPTEAPSLDGSENNEKDESEPEAELTNSDTSVSDSDENIPIDDSEEDVESEEDNESDDELEKRFDNTKFDAKQIKEIMRESIKKMVKKYIEDDKDFLPESDKEPYSTFNDLLESIYDGGFFERIPIEERKKKLVNQFTPEQIKDMNQQLSKIKDIYKNSAPSVIDILNMKCSIEQKQKLLEKVYCLANSEVLTPEYNSNLKFLTSNISNETDPTLLELEERILKSAVNSGIFDSYKTKILKSKMSFENKVIAYKKLEIMETYEETDTSEYAKYKNWMDTLLAVPFGIFNEIPVNMNSSIEELQNYIKTVRQTLDAKLSFLEKPKDQIINIVSQMIRNPECNINAIGLYGPKGCGKCMGINTPVLMFDGSIKLVQDIKVGDKLMGDNSSCRNVISLARGQEEMFEINHVLHNETYTVNKSHILTLKMSDNKRLFDRTSRNSYVVRWFDDKNITLRSKHFNYNNQSKDKIYLEAQKFFNDIYENKIVDISVKDYLELPKSVRTHLQGFKVGVEFEEKSLNFDPYIIGLWLGDGTSTRAEITNQDSTIIHYLLTNLPKYKCYLQYDNKADNKYKYRINGDGSGKIGSNTFLNELKSNNLINNKHIPDIYKINSRKNRLKLLAGLIDSDGSITYKKCGYDITQKNNKLTNDIVYLCRSLGFQCKSSKTLKGCMYKGEYKEGEYNRITIYGNGIEDIPVLCPRKKSTKRMQIKDPLVTAITVTSKGTGNYYGFELDGNNRFLLGNFIVTHNTSVATSIADALSRPLRTISLGGESDASTLTGHGFTYIGSNAGRFIEILRETKTMNPVILIDELDKVSESVHGKEIIGTLIHLTDSTSNSKYNYDKYFSGIDFDLSKVLFIFTYNDPSKVDKILADRLYKIKVDNYSLSEKLEIANKHLINTVLDKLKFDKDKFTFSEEAVRYLVESSKEDEGMRTIKTKIKIILTRINILLLTNPNDNIIMLKYKKLYDYYHGKESILIPKEHIDILLNESISNDLEIKPPPFGMYI
jgi:hypothetical protein